VLFEGWEPCSSPALRDELGLPEKSTRLGFRLCRVSANNQQSLADKGTYACRPGRRLSGGLTAVVSGHPGLGLRLFVHITQRYALQSLHVFLHQDLVVLHHFQLRNLG
jgi:hypothetical protein